MRDTCISKSFINVKLIWVWKSEKGFQPYLYDVLNLLWNFLFQSLIFKIFHRTYIKDKLFFKFVIKILIVRKFAIHAATRGVWLLPLSVKDRSNFFFTIDRVRNSQRRSFFSRRRSSINSSEKVGSFFFSWHRCRKRSTRRTRNRFLPWHH